MCLQFKSQKQTNNGFVRISEKPGAKLHSVLFTVTTQCRQSAVHQETDV